jgi:hypothetical protein
MSGYVDCSILVFTDNPVSDYVRRPMLGREPNMAGDHRQVEPAKLLTRGDPG